MIEWFFELTIGQGVISLQEWDFGLMGSIRLHRVPATARRGHYQQLVAFLAWLVRVFLERGHRETLSGWVWLMTR